MSTGRARVVKKQIEGILQKSYDWLAWNSALEAAFVLEEGDRELFFCVDASEVVEYLLPSSLRQSSYPTSLDLSLLIVFKPGRQLFVLPPHLLELRSLSGVWSERLRVAAQQLTLLKESAPQLKESSQKELDRLTAEEPDEQVLDQFVDLILRERSFFSKVFSLPLQQGRSLDSLIHRLALPDQSCLGLEGWRYEPEPGRVDFWYEQLAASEVGRGGPPSHLVDAHALHMIELLNQALPGERFLLLSTQSEKIWEVVEKAREADGEALMKAGLSLVQRPQLALVKTLLKDEDSRARNRERLIVEKERGGSLGEMRRRLQKEILPFLEKGDSDHLDFTQIEQLVQDLEIGIERLDSVSRDKQWIERLRLAFDPSVEQTEGSLREQFLGAMKDNRREAMQEVLSRRLGELIAELEDLQQRLSLAAVTTPSPPMSFESEEPSFGIRGILNSQPGGHAYSLRFQSPILPAHLLRIQDLLEALDRAPSDPEQRRLNVYELQQEMYRCEVEHREEPEYYLLLALVFSSRQMWFQSYDAADQGLKKIRAREHPGAPSAPDRAAASATTELLFAQASAFTNWTLERYADLPAVAERFLGRAAGMARQSLRLQQQWAAVLHPVGDLDPRCLRELGNIYGTAREAQIPLAVDAGDRELAGLPAEPPPDLLDAFLGLARLAYRWGRDDDRMRVHYVNSLLYAMTEKDSPRDLVERRELAGILAAEDALDGDPNFLDTLAWHHFRLARRLQREGLPFAPDLHIAHERIESAWGHLKRNRRWRGNGYYERLIERHCTEIAAAWEEHHP